MHNLESPPEPIPPLDALLRGVVADGWGDGGGHPSAYQQWAVPRVQLLQNPYLPYATTQGSQGQSPDKTRGTEGGGERGLIRGMGWDGISLVLGRRRLVG